MHACARVCARAHYPYVARHSDHIRMCVPCARATSECDRLAFQHLFATRHLYVTNAHALHKSRLCSQVHFLNVCTYTPIWYVSPICCNDERLLTIFHITHKQPDSLNSGRWLRTEVLRIHDKRCLFSCVCVNEHMCSVTTETDR